MAHIPRVTPLARVTEQAFGPAGAPGEPANGARKAQGWHHGHFDGGMVAHQHGHAFHKAHPHHGR